MKRFLVRHLGNMGDMVFFVPPVLETLKKKYPDCHITLVLPWGFKERKRTLGKWKIEKRDVWGKRNQGGFSIHLMMTNPHVDQIIHWHDTLLDLDGTICVEDGKSFPTWNRNYYEEQKASGNYDGVYELDFGLGIQDNPIERMYEVIGLPGQEYSNYKLYLTHENARVAQEVMRDLPHPRIVFLEGIEGRTTRGWDPGKVETLKREIRKKWGVDPLWFGGKYVRHYEGRPLTLRENIATLLYCDVAIGVMSGPLHFAAAVGLPTITLFGDQPLHRAAPAYFLNQYISDISKKHRTLLGPTNIDDMRFLKDDAPFVNLTPSEAKGQGYTSWIEPGVQSTKSCISVITVSEVLPVLEDALEKSRS